MLAAADFDVPALRDGDLAGAGPRLTFVPTSASSLPSATGSVDVVLSNSFLEHVDDLDAVLSEIARVTAVGGFGVHQIDGVDHRSYADPTVGPHDFLRDPPGAMAHGSNRVRMLDFPEHFTRHHFPVQQVLSRRIDISDDEIATFAEPWRSMSRETLETVQATLMLRRT